jgi:hypothetical protein
LLIRQSAALTDLRKLRASRFGATSRDTARMTLAAISTIVVEQRVQVDRPNADAKAGLCRAAT